MPFVTRHSSFVPAGARLYKFFRLHDLAAAIGATTRAGAVPHLRGAAGRALHQVRLVEAAIILAAALTRAGLRMLSFGISHGYKGLGDTRR